MNNIGSEIFYRSFSLVKLPRIERDRASSEWEKCVFPHSPLQELAPQIWHVTGTLGRAFPPREAIVYRLRDSTLLLHSPIALAETEMQKLESLGEPKIAIVPNRIHRLDIAIFKQRYPDLIIVAPQAAKPYVEEVVAVDAIAETFLPNYGIVCHTPEGIRPQELVYELPLDSGKALIFTDILFNLTESYLDRYAPRSKSLVRFLGAKDYFGITPLGQRFFLTDKTAYRQWLEGLSVRVAPLETICVAHGAPITRNCSARLQEAADRLSSS